MKGRYKMLKGKEFIECKTQQEVDECCKKGNIAIVRSGFFIAYDSSQVTALDSSQVTAYDSSQVTAYGSSQVRALDSSQVRALDSSQVTAYGYVAITQHSNCAIIKADRNCVLLKVPDINSINDYCERYPIEQDGDYIYLYKAVGSSMKSFYDNKTEYPESGIIKISKLAPKEAGSCAEGLHFSYYDWAINFGLQHNDFIILKARIKKDRIVVSPDCDGKVRTDEAEIVEVIDDWRNYKPDLGGD
jgi:hypothetical protein